MDAEGLIDDPDFIASAVKFARDWYADHVHMMARAGIDLPQFNDLPIEQVERYANIAGERVIQQNRQSYCPHIIEIGS